MYAAQLVLVWGKVCWKWGSGEVCAGNVHKIYLHMNFMKSCGAAVVH